MHKEIADFINKEVPNAKASVKSAEVGDSSIMVEPSEIKNVCKALRDSKEFNFNALQVVSAVDFPNDKQIEVNYMLASFSENRSEVIIKVRLDRGTEQDLPKIESVTDIWASANFLERECYDMLGIIFEGHPDLRRILCPYDWEGYPLRKDYVVQEKYLDMVVNPVDKMNNPEREFVVEQNRKNDEAKAREKADA